MRFFSYLTQFLLLVIMLIKAHAQICSTNPTSLIQNSLIAGVCATVYQPSDQIVRDSTQITLTGVQRFSISSWVKISSAATDPEYSLFRLTEDQATTTPTNDKAIRLTMLIGRTTQQIKIQFSKTGVFQVVDSTALAYAYDNWMFLFVSYDLVSGYIYYAAYHPNLSPSLDLTLSTITKNIPLTANFHTALSSVAKLELFYWGTYNKFCGSINRFVYYSGYAIQSTQWMIQALTDGSIAEQNLLYLRLEFSDPSDPLQKITDFSVQTNRNDAVLGFTSAVEPSDPTIPLSSLNGLTLQTGQVVTVNDHRWDGQKGFVVSFWVYIPSALTINADADTTDAQNDIQLISKQTGANYFKILIFGARYIKLRINDQIFSDNVNQLAGNAWSQVTVSVALYTNAASFYNYYIVKIDYKNLSTTGYFKVASSILWDESVLQGIKIGSAANNFTGNIKVSQLKIESGLGVYYNSLNCISNCDIAFAKYGSIKCLLCSNTFYEQNGICFSVCDNSGFGMKNSNIRTCSTCDISCTYCQGDVSTSYTCTDCSNNYFLSVLLPGKCVVAASCGASYMANPFTQQCTLCGNGVIDGLEECDDGNFNSYDGCTNCTIDPLFDCDTSLPNKCAIKCGNKTKTADEQCDDGNQIDNDGCTNCNIDTGYICNTGVNPNTCTLLCGNGVIDLNEECDDGDSIKGNGCTNCLVDIGYKCPTPNVLCTSLCGNGVRDTNEQCDDNNLTSNDGCTNCIVDDGYQCNGGTSNTPDVCLITCFDGIKQDNEECDDGNGNNNDGCSSACKIESGYTCTNASPSVCTLIASVCGDGKKTASEACDNGTILPINGCNATCTAVVLGFECKGGSLTTPDTCTPICGDGKKVGNEQCDDGNLLVGDGCDQNCQIENNYLCSGGSSIQKDTCTSSCGNGVQDAGEECDDENQNNGDGCSSNCKIEIGYSCTQIVVGGRDSCFLCATNCLKCTSKSIKDCEICFPNYFKNPVTGQCDQQCSDGYFIDEVNQACTACLDSNCKRCLSNDKQSCLECQNDTYIAQGDCFQTCPFGFYPTINPVIGKECTTCPFPCAGCTSNKDCQQCADLYYLDQKTQKCQLCNLDPKCYQCDFTAKKCLKCEIGYKVNGAKCDAFPNVCGDGYLQPNSEQCDDGNKIDGDGCSSLCQVEVNFNCILKDNEQPSICYQKRPTLVSGSLSLIDYNIIYINFEREIQKQPENITQSDIIIKINSINSKNFNYTMNFIDANTIQVSFNYTKTIHNLEAFVDFSKSFKSQIMDIYNYTLATQFQAFSVPLPYFIYYSDAEIQSALAISWVFVVLTLILMAPIFAYLYSFGQGRVFKIIEVIQVIGLMRFDIFSYQLFQQADLFFNLRGMYSIFDSIPISAEDEQNFLNKDNLTVLRQQMNTSFVHTFLGTIIMSYIILSIIQSLNQLLYKFVEIDQVTQITEKIKEFMHWDAYIKLFDFFLYYLAISIFLGIQSFSVETPLSIANFVLSLLSLLGVVALGVFLMKKFVLYPKLHKRTDWFESYLTLFDGLKFNVKRAKFYILYPYINKVLYAGVLVFLHNSPFLQIICCAAVRGIHIIVILCTHPFHFNFMQRRDIASELFLMLMIVICLNCTDDNSESSQKRIMAIILISLPFLFIFAYSSLYLWTVTQEDIYFDPIPIVPLQANPEDWMSQQEDNSKQQSSKKGDDDDDVAEPKRNQILPLDGDDKSGSNNQEDDYNIAPSVNQNNNNLIIKEEEDDENEDDDIFAAPNQNSKQISNFNSQNQKSSSQSVGRVINVGNDNEDDDEDEDDYASQQNEIKNYQR